MADDAGSGAGADQYWPQWRGPRGTGVAPLQRQIYDTITAVTRQIAVQAGDPDPDHTADLVHLAVYSMMGMALERSAQRSDSETHRLIAKFRDII